MEPGNTTSNLFDLQIDHESNAYLSETAKWTKYLSILGFVFCGLIVLASIFAGSFMSGLFLNRYSGNMGSGTAAGISTATGIGITLVYSLFALLYFFPSLYLFNFSSKMQVALRNNDQAQLNLSFKNLKSCFKFWGILTIVIIGFYLLVLIFALFAGIASR
jgi:hypothetical protein